MDWEFLEALRRHECEQALARLGEMKPPPARLVEIGGGSGWQARALADAGYDVVSFDLPCSDYAGRRAFPVEDYDGHHLPVDTASVDIVFSSNVLEHIPHVAAFQAELQRILKPDGVALHLLPTAGWRLWSTLTHYPWVMRNAVRRLGLAAGRRWIAGEQSPPQASAPIAAAGLGRRLRHVLLPPRHGEFGNVATEAYYFSRYRWQRLFERSGWTVVAYETNRLAYTGHSLIGARLGLASRRRLSRVLGSACHLFVLARR